MDDRFGLRAIYSFQITGDAMSNMASVRDQLRGIIDAVRNLSETSSTATPRMGRDFGQMSTRMARGTAQASNSLNSFAQAAKAVRDRLQPLKSEFRALRAESRNIDFGDLTDSEQFKQASQDIQNYISSLQSLERQIQGNTFAEREFGASLKQQQRIGQTRIDMASEQRKAAIASQRLGVSQGLQSTGQSILGTLDAPIQSAQELQQSLGNVKKLADDLSSEGYRELTNSALNFSAAMGVADTEITAIYEDLAGAGKSFGKELQDRIGETEGILQVKSALDVSIGAATQLDITLGSIYKHSLTDYAGGVVELNQRTASSINELADNLQNVRISAEDVIPVMKVVMNVAGDAKNFPVSDIAAYGAAISALGTVEPEAAGSFFNRLGTSMAGKFKGSFIENLGYGDEATFGQAIDTDKLGVLLRILEKYKNMEGGELVKGSFLSNIGIKSAQDQKLIQGLANNLDVLIEARKVAAAGFQGQAGQDLSVQAEFNRTMQTGAFQSRRFKAAITALKDTLGLAIQDALTPFMVNLSDIITVVLKFTQKYPGLTRAIALGTFGFGALATAVGTAGIVLFGFQQASATASVAMLSMRSSLLPLTGFFETGLAGMTGGTNALTISLGLLGRAGSLAVAPFTVLGSVLSFLASPIVLAIASLTSLYLLLESLTPQVNLLGRSFSLIAAPVGFIKGLLSGFISGIIPAIAPLGNQIKHSLVRPLSVVSEAVQQAANTFAEFSAKGELFGNQLAQGLITGFTRIGTVWDYTINWIKSRIAPLVSFFRSVGQMFVSALAENSPGPTFQIRAKWDMTIEYIKEKIASLRMAISDIGQQITALFSRFVVSIQNNFDTYLTYGIRGAIRAATRVLYSEFSLSGAESISVVTGFLGLIKGEFVQFVDAIASISLSRGVVNLFEPLQNGFSLIGAAIGVQVQTILTNSRVFQTALSGIATAVSYVAKNLPILTSGVNHVTLAFRALTPALRRIVPGLGIILFLIDTIHLLYRGLNFLDTKLGWTWLDGLVGGLKTASDAIDLVTSKIRGFIVSGITALISTISTNWSQGFTSITESWQSWVARIIAGIARARDAIASIPDNLSATFDTLLADSQAALVSFTTNLQSWFRSLGSTLVHFVPNTIRGVFERLNLANFILLFTSSLPLGLLSGQIKTMFIAAAARALPGIAAALGLAAFGPLVEAIALALPVVASLLVSSGIADKVTDFFTTVFTQAVDYAVNELGLQLPDWLKTVGAFTGALDHFFRQLGQLALSIPTPAFFTVLSPFILAIVSRFNQATKAFELFVERAGGVRAVLILMGQGLRKLVAPLGAVAKTIVGILTGPPPDLGFLIRPLIAAFNYIKPLIQPIISVVATVLRPLLLSLGTALQPLITTITSVTSQIYTVLLPAITAIRANLLSAIAAVLESPAFTALLPFLNLVGGGAIAAGLGVARAASGGAAAVAGGVKSAIDIAAPRLVQAGDFSVRILGNILKTVLLIAKELTGAAIAPLNILQEVLDFTNVERVTQAAGRVTPIDLLPFFEDVRLGKIQKQSGVLVNSLGPLGRALVQLRFSFVAILEVVGFLGLGLVALEGYLKATGSSFSIFGTAAVIAAQALNVARVAIYALRLAWVSLRYITLDLTNNLIPPKLAEATPQWVKTTSAVLKVLRDAFLLTARVVTGALYGIAIALKAVYSTIVLLGVVPALQVLKYGLILVKSALEIVTGDFHSLARGAEIVKGAISGVVAVVYNLRDILIPVALIFGTLLFPRIGLVVTVAVELVRGFKDVRNIFNLTYQAIKFVVGGLYELRGAIALVSFALFAVFNLSSPWLIALTAGIGWVVEWTRGFRELHQIIDALSNAITFLDKSIKGLIDSVFAPISFGPFQGMVEFIKNNWPVIVGAFVAFNIFLTRNLFQGFQKSFGIVPRMIGLISLSFQKMVGVFSQIFPFFDRFRREVVTLRGETLVAQAEMFQGEYVGGRPKATIGDRERLGRQQEILKFRSLLEQEAMSEARRRHTEKRLQKTYSFRTDEGYEQRLMNPRGGSLDPRRMLDAIEARTVQFSSKQIESARTNVLKDYERMSAISQKAGLGGFSLPQLQAMSAREGSDYYTQKGILPTLDAKYIEIRAGKVSVSAGWKQGRRQGIGSIDQEQQIQGSYAEFRKTAKGLHKELAKLSDDQIGVPGAAARGLDNISAANSFDTGILGDLYNLRTGRELRPLTTQQEQRVADVLKQLSNQSGSVNLDKLKEVAEHMLIPGARGRMVPPELVEFEQAILEAKIRRQASPSTFDSYEPKGFVEIIRAMQSEKDARRLMEGQGYDEAFINQALTTITRSRKPTRDPQMRQFNQRKLNELMATLMSSEFSLGTTRDGDAGELYYRSPLVDKPKGIAGQEEMGVSSQAIFSKFLSVPTYKDTVAKVAQQQESRTRNQSTVRQALVSMYADKFDFGSIIKGTQPNKTAKNAVRSFLVELAQKSGSPLDDAEIDMLKSELSKVNTAQQFQEFIKKEIVNKRQGKEFGKFLEQYRAAVFLREQDITPTEKINEQTKKAEKIPVLETMRGNSKVISNLQQGNFEVLVRKYGFDLGNVGAIASRSSLDVDELYSGEKIPQANKMYARRLRESKVESFAQNAGYSGIDQMLEEMAQDQTGAVDPNRLNAAKEKYRKVIEADWGNKKTVEAMQQFSRNLGMSDKDFMDTILSSNLLDEEKSTPKGLGRKVGQFLSLRKNKLTAGLVAGLYQDADLRNAQSKINRNLEQTAKDRVMGLDAIITQTGGSLPDLLKTLDVQVSASDFRKQLRVDPSIAKLKEMLGGGELGVKKLRQLSAALGTTTDKLLSTIEDASNLTQVEKLQIGFYTTLKEFGHKTSFVFQKIGNNITDFSLGFQNLIGLGKLDSYYRRLRKVYSKNLEQYNKKNAHNLNFMIQEAGFETMDGFVTYLNRSGIDKIAVGNLLKGKTGAIEDKSLKDIARILGLTKQNDAGEQIPDIGMLKSSNFSTNAYKPYQSFFTFGLHATLRSKFIRRNLSQSMQTGIGNAISSSSQLLTQVGQVNFRQSIEAIASSIEGAVARFSMKIATGGGEPVTVMERLGKEVRRQIAVNLNKLTLLATTPLKKIAAVAPNSKVTEIINAAYRSIPDRLLVIAQATRDSAERMVNRGFGYQREIARSDFFENLASKLENFQNNYPTVRTAIAGMFTSMGVGFQQLGSVINAKALDVAKKIGFDDLYVKFKQAIKQVPGFSDVDRAARIATIQGFLKQVRKGANAAAQSAEQRRIQFAQPKILGQGGYSVTDAAGNRASRIEERLNRPDSKFSPAARQYLERRGYNIESIAPEQQQPEAIYGPFVKAFRTIAKAARVSEGLVERALSNPVVYVLTRWTDLTWFFLKKLPGAIASGMNAATSAVGSATRRMVDGIRNAFVHVVSRVIVVFPESAGIIIGSLNLISRASRFVGNEIGQFLTSPTNWIASRWASTVNFLTGLFPKLVNFTKWIGKKIQGNLSEASPGPTYQIRQNYDATTEHVIGDMNQMAAHSVTAGHQIEGAMVHAAHATDQALTHATRNPLAAFGKLQQAVMAIGGLGVGLSTLGNALQESNPAIAGTLTKLSEVVFAVDAVGGAFYALQQFGGNLFEFFTDENVLSFLKAVKTRALATLPAIRAFGATLKAQFLSGALLTNPIFLAIAGITTAVTALYFAFKNNFLGIRDLVASVAPIFQRVAEIITGAIISISNAISALTNNMGTMLPQILLIGAVTVSSMDSLPIKEILVSKMELAEKAIAPIAARISRKIQGDTHYTTLGITPTASPQDVKAAYRSKAKQFHPDLNQSQAAIDEFHKVTEAYKTLADAERRVAYDAVASTRAMGGFTNSVKRLPQLLSSGVSGGMGLLKNFIKELPAIVDSVGRRSLELVKLLMGDAVSAVASNFPKLYKIIERIGQAILKKFNQLGTGMKKFIGFFLGPTDVAAFGMHRLGDAVSGISPQVGKALHGLGDLTTWYGDFMGLHSMVYAGLKKFKLTQPLANLAKSIATSHPLLEKFARFSKGLADDGFEFLSHNYGDRFKAQLDKLTPALNSLKSKFSDFATSAISAFSTRWSSFVTAWPGMVDGAVKAVQPKFQGLTNLLTGVGSQMLITGTSLTQPLLRAGTAAAVQVGVLVPANQAISASYAETAIAANSSSLAIVKSSGTSAIAVATEAGEIIPLNFSMAGSFGALAAGVTTATTAVWAFISPWVIAVSTALAPFLPVILGVVGAVALFGFVWKTNLFGLGAAIKPLLDFSVGLLKIVGAAIYVVSGLFLVVNAAKLTWMILKNIFTGINKTVQETKKTVAQSWFGGFLARVVAPIKFVWNSLMTLSEAILGIGRGGQILHAILEDIANRPVHFLQVAFRGIQKLIASLIKPLLSLTTGAWNLAKAFGQGVGNAIASLGSVFQNTGSGIKGAWIAVINFLQSAFGRVVGFLESIDWNVVMVGVRDVLVGIGTAIAQPFVWIYNQIDAIAKKSTEVFDALGEKLSRIPVIGIAFQKGSPTAQVQDPSQDGLVNASSTVGNAWDGATSRVADTLTSLPKIGEKVGNLLIGALNCSPTEQIPDAWESASERIQSTLNSVLKFALVVGGGIVAALATNKLMGLMSGRAIGVRASKMGTKFIKGSLYANALNDAAGLAGIDMPDWSQSLLSLTTFVGLAGDLVAEVIPAIATGAAGIGLSLSAVVGVATGGVAVIAGLALAWNKNLFDIQGKTKAFVSMMGGWLSKVPVLGSFLNKGKESEVTNVAMKPVTDPITSAPGTIDTAWSDATTRIEESIGNLPSAGQEAGQGLISALNCWPTQVIPQAWERAAGQISGTLVGLTQEATAQGTAIAQGMQEQIAPSINRVAQKVALLKQGFNMRGAELVLGEQSIGDQLATLQGATIDFKRNLINALLHLDFEGAKQSLVTYGEAWLATGGGVLGTLKSMTTSAIAFGIYSLLSINPVLLVMGGIALGALAIAFNFLGVRTILGGLINVIKGLIKFLVSTIKFAIQLGRAFRTITQGILSLDFNMIRRGAAQAFGAIGLYVIRVKESFIQVLGGAIQVLQGLFEGLGQIGGTALQLIGLRGGFIRNVFAGVINGAMYLGSALMTLVTKPQLVWQKLKALLDQIWGKISGITNKVTAAAGNVGEAVKGSVVGRAVRTAQKRMSGKSPTLSDARAAVDFEERIKGKEPGLSVGDNLVSARAGIKNRVGGFFNRLTRREQGVTTSPSAIPSTGESVSEISRITPPSSVPISLRPVSKQPPLLPGATVPVVSIPTNIIPQSEVSAPASSVPRPTPVSTAPSLEADGVDDLTLRQQKLTSVIGASQDALSSLSVAVGAIAPQFAAPVYAASSLFTAVASIGQVAENSGEAFSGLANVFPGVSRAIGGVGQKVKDLTSGLTSSLSIAPSFQKASNLTARANRFLSRTFDSVKEFARKTYQQIIVNYQAFGAYDTASMILGKANQFISSSFISLKGFASQSWNQLVAFYKQTTFASVASRIIASANEFIGASFGNIKEFASFAKKELVDVYTKSGAASVLSKVISSANESISATFKPIAEFAKNAWLAIVKAYQESGLAASVSRVIGAANSFISNSFASMKEFARKAWTQMVVNYQVFGAYDTASMVMSRANEMISSSFASVKKLANQARESIVATYKQGGVAALWSKSIGAANKFISSSFATIKKFATQAWQGIVSAYKGSALASALSKTIQEANRLISSSFTSIKQFATRAWQSMVAAYKNGGIAAVGSKVITVVNDLISRSFNSVKQFATRAWQSMVTAYRNGGVAASGARIIGAANELISKSFLGLKNFAAQAWQSIVAGYQQGKLAAISSNIIAGINNFLSGSFGSLKGFSLNAWKEIVSGYKQGILAAQAQAAQRTALAAQAAAQAAIEVPANTAIAASEKAVAMASASAGAAQVQSAATGSAATVAGAGAVTGANSTMAFSFSSLGMVAGQAWAAIIGPLLPIIVAVGVLAVVIGAVYFAFKNNFLGFGTLIKTFWKSLKELGGSLKTLFSPLMPLFKLIGGLILLAIVSPIMLVVGALTLAIKGINALVQGVIAIASTAFKFLWNLIPQPLRWLLEQASKGIGFAINALFGGDKGAQQQTEELPQFAVGGPVSANTPGGPVAAILHDNEFVMNPDATRENYGLLQLLNSGVSAEDAIRMIPTTPPELVMPTGSRGGVATANTTTEPPKIELNITFTGNIVLGGNSSRENAREFMNLIGPEIEELVVEAMRQRGEFSR